MSLIERVIHKTSITNIEHYAWQALANGDEGTSFKFAKPTDKTYHIYGDFGGGTLQLEGSNDLRADPEHEDHASANWFVLSNVKGDSIAVSTDAAGVVSENPLFMRCTLSGGAAGSVDVQIVAKRVF